MLDNLTVVQPINGTEVFCWFQDDTKQGQQPARAPGGAPVPART